MASNTTSPLSEDNTSGTNLSLIPTEDEKQTQQTGCQQNVRNYNI